MKGVVVRKVVELFALQIQHHAVFTSCAPFDRSDHRVAKILRCHKAVQVSVPIYEIRADQIEIILIVCFQHRRICGVGRFIEGLGPYQSLVLLVVPTSLVEPLKLVSVAVAGDGHWITGTIMIIVAYAASLMFVERLFRIVKPKLLALPWFARTWDWLIALRIKTVARFRRV